MQSQTSFAFPVGFKVDENDRFLLDSNHNDQTITLSDVGSLTFAEIRRADRLQINDTNDSFHYGKSEEDSILMESGDNVVMEDFSTNSNQARLLLNLGEEVILEDAINPLLSGNIKLENEDGAIILDATDSSSSNAGDFVNLEDFHREREDGNILLETHNVFPSRGHIPLSNFSINSSNKVTAGIVQGQKYW